MQAAVPKLHNLSSIVASELHSKSRLDATSVAGLCGMESDRSTANLLGRLQRMVSTSHLSDETLTSISATLVELRSSLGGTDAGALHHIPSQSINADLNEGTENAVRTSRHIEALRPGIATVTYSKPRFRQTRGNSEQCTLWADDQPSVTLALFPQNVFPTRSGYLQGRDGPTHGAAEVQGLAMKV